MKDTIKEQVTYAHFVSTICEDFGVSPEKKICIKSLTKPNIKQFVRGCASNVEIVTEEGVYPFMIDAISKNGKTFRKRNDEKLKKATRLKKTRTKFLSEIIEELGLKLKSEKCRVCEGGGCYSEGERIYYKDLFIEV